MILEVLNKEIILGSSRVVFCYKYLVILVCDVIYIYFCNYPVIKHYSFFSILRMKVVQVGTKVGNRVDASYIHIKKPCAYGYNVE